MVLHGDALFVVFVFVHQTFFNSLAHVLFGSVVADGSVNVIADFPFGDD